MSNELNPYAAPEPVKTQPSKRSRPIKLVGTALWWSYFAILCWFFVLNVKSLLVWVHFHSIATASPLHGFEVVIQALGLICFICYLQRIPLLHSFFWGWVFFSQLGVTLYRITYWVHFFFKFDEHYWDWRIAMLYASVFAPIPQCYLLWRYSSTSSPIWQRPRIAWRRLAQRLGGMILRLRRA